MCSVDQRSREVLDLKRGQYNAKEGTLRLEPGSTKNGEGRTVHLTPDLGAMLDTQAARVRLFRSGRGW